MCKFTVMLSKRHELDFLFIMFEAGAVCDEIALFRCIFPLGLAELVESFIRWCSTNPRVEFVPPGSLSSPELGSNLLPVLFDK